MLIYFKFILTVFNNGSRKAIILYSCLTVDIEWSWISEHRTFKWSIQLHLLLYNTAKLNKWIKLQFLFKIPRQTFIGAMQFILIHFSVVNLLSVLKKKNRRKRVLMNIGVSHLLCLAIWFYYFSISKIIDSILFYWIFCVACFLTEAIKNLPILISKL